MRFVLPLLLAMLVLGGCDRPFVEPTLPELDLVEPDLSIIQTDAELTLAFRAGSLGDLTEVRIDGMPAQRDGDLYRGTVILDPGLNRILADAVASEGAIRSDTLYAVYLPYESEVLEEVLPEPVGFHALTPLADGTLLLTGGAGRVDGPSREVAYLLAPEAGFAATMLPLMNTPRAGHTASLLPDGRVLIVGGSRVGFPQSLADLVPEVELFDPRTQQFQPVEVEGAGPLRTFHTAAVIDGNDGITLMLYGGVGNINTTEPLRFGTRADFRFFRLEEEAGGALRLRALSPRVGPQFVPLAGHTQTPLAEAVGGAGRYLIAGSRASGTAVDTVAFAFDVRPDLQVLDRPLPPMHTRRQYHAAAPLLQGLTLLSGGIDPRTGQMIGMPEVFADPPERFFRFPTEAAPLALPRWGQRATNLGDQRILLVGGFGPAGGALPLLELYAPRN